MEENSRVGYLLSLMVVLNILILIYVIRGVVWSEEYPIATPEGIQDSFGILGVADPGITDLISDGEKVNF